MFDPTDEATALAYDDAPVWSHLAGALLLEHVPLRAGAALLDVGCGTGFPLLEIAARLGPGSRAAGIDPWSAGVRRARSKAAGRGLVDVEILEGDASAMPFPDAVFDLVVSNLGVNNFEDPHSVLVECRRVMKPGATIALASNVRGHFRELYEALGAVLTDDDARRDLADHVASRPEGQDVAASLEEAGFGVARVLRSEASLRFADARALLAHPFVKLAFLPAWLEIAGEAGVEAMGAELDRRAGPGRPIRLSVPLAYVEARND